MARPRRNSRSPGGRPVLSRDGIVDAALALTLDTPLDTLTLARLGQELGADPTAVYRHFRSRDELLLHVVDVIYGEAVAELAEQDDWRADLAAVAHGARDRMLRRPGLAAEFGSRFTGGPNERAGLLHLRDVLERAGFGPELATTHARVFGAFIAATTAATAGLLIHEPESGADDMAISLSIFGVEPGQSVYAYEEDVFALMLRIQIAGLDALLVDAPTTSTSTTTTTTPAGTTQGAGT